MCFSEAYSLGNYLASIESVSTPSPYASTKEVTDKVSSRLWEKFWNKTISHWHDSCLSNNKAELWEASVGTRAIGFSGNKSRAGQAASSLLSYKDSSSGGYSALYPGTNDIYIDDDAQANWAFTTAYNVTKNSTFHDVARDMLKFMMSHVNDKVGGITWHVNNNYIASISTLEAGLAALRVNEIKHDEDFVNFGKYCLNWTFSNLLDPHDHFIYDGMDENHKVNKQKYSYTIGVAISALVKLHQIDDTKNWKRMATELAARAIGNGKLNSIYYQNQYLKDGVKFVHLLLVGFTDLVTQTQPQSDFERNLYKALKNEVIRETRHIFDDNKNAMFNSSSCPQGQWGSLLSFSSVSQIFYQAKILTSFM